jgi:hypothetical protein
MTSEKQVIISARTDLDRLEAIEFFRWLGNVYRELGFCRSLLRLSHPYGG